MSEVSAVIYLNDSSPINITSKLAEYNKQNYDTKFKENILKPFLRHTGPCISPFNAWVLLKSLETIKIRVLSQSDNALQIASFLEKHKKENT